MLSRAAVGSSALRRMLRRPLRTGLLFNTGIHSSLPVAHSITCRREYSKKAPKWERQWVDRALRYRLPPKKGNSEKPIDYSTQEGVLRVLANEIRSWRENTALGLKTSQWGLRSEVLRAILTQKDPNHPQKDGSSHTIGTALLTMWSEEALSSLESTSTTSSTSILDLENATHALAAEGTDCIPRLLMNSYLRWLEVAAKGTTRGISIASSHTELTLIGRHATT